MKKAYRYDELIFYFDAFDNKYVASGGSLAWRSNNPGLLLSHSLHRMGYYAIGAHHQYAIFSHLVIGKEALRVWLASTKYCDSPLIEIAKYYQPNTPEAYLQQLCKITGFNPTTKPRSLSSKDFEKLLKAIQQLAGFSPENEHQFLPLPKITARYYSSNRKVEYYLAGYEHLLTKQQAIDWVETHRLDAVREIGQVHEGQCIWGFINGMFNSALQAQKSATFISKCTGDQNVIYLVNDAGCLGNASDAAMQKKGIHNQTVKFGAQFFRMLIKLSDANPSKDKPPIVIFTHSQGALIANLALNRLEPQERQRLRIFTLGGAAFIAPDFAHPE